MSTQNLPLFAAGCVTFVDAGIGIIICQVRTLFHKQVQSILPILEHAAKAQRPLLIIAEDVENEARSLIAVYGCLWDDGRCRSIYLSLVFLIGKGWGFS